MTLTIPPPGQVLRWLGGPIDVRVEVEAGLEGVELAVWDEAVWDDGVWGALDIEWTDVTEFIYSVEIRAGAQRWGERFESASATLSVDNTEGIWTAESEVPYFFKTIRPGRPVRIIAYPDPDDPGNKQYLFSGVIDSLTDLFDDAGHFITTAIQCSDFIAVLQAYNPTMLEDPTGVQSTDARINAALDRIDWPVADRVVAAGLHTMQSSHLAQSVWEECARAADAEGGAFYSDRTGRAVFKNRDWLTTDTRSVNVQGYFGFDEVPDAAAMMGHVLAVVVSHEAARIFNYVSMARATSTLQTVEDLDSQALHRRRTYQRTDLENNADSEVAFLAARYLAAYKDDRMRIDSITIGAVEDPDGDDLNRVMWDTRFGDRFAVRIQTGWGWHIDKEVHVFALNHVITGDDWTLTLTLDDAQTFEDAAALMNGDTDA